MACKIRVDKKAPEPQIYTSQIQRPTDWPSEWVNGLDCRATNVAIKVKSHGFDTLLKCDSDDKIENHSQRICFWGLLAKSATDANESKYCNWNFANVKISNIIFK